MTDDDKKLFLEGLTFLAESFNRRVSSLLLETYWQCLRPYPLTKVKTAMADILTNPDREIWGMPIPSELISLIQGDSRQFAQNAWTQVVHAIKTIGRYDSVVFDNAIIHCVIRDLGGWIYLCHQPERALPSLRENFIKRFQKYHANPSVHYPCVLKGVSEHDNDARGFSHNKPDPILVGDPQRALTVYKSGNKLLESSFQLPLSKAIQQFDPEK